MSGVAQACQGTARRKGIRGTLMLLSEESYVMAPSCRFLQRNAKGASA